MTTTDKLFKLPKWKDDLDRILADCEYDFEVGLEEFFTKTPRDEWPTWTDMEDHVAYLIIPDEVQRVISRAYDN